MIRISFPLHHMDHAAFYLIFTRIEPHHRISRYRLLYIHHRWTSSVTGFHKPVTVPTLMSLLWCGHIIDRRVTDDKGL